MDYGNTKTPGMHCRLGSTTLLQLAFPREGNQNFPWEKSHWGNPVVKSNNKKREKKKQVLQPPSDNRPSISLTTWFNAHSLLTIHVNQTLPKDHSPSRSLGLILISSSLGSTLMSSSLHVSQPLTQHQLSYSFFSFLKIGFRMVIHKGFHCTIK